MKNLVLASVLGTLAGASAIPAIAGPVHFAVTRPYSLFGLMPSGTPATVILGTVPLDFIMTDVLLGGTISGVVVTVNGNPVFNCGMETYQSGASAYQRSRSEHLTGGVFIPAGSSVGVQCTYGSGGPVTLAGYVQ